MKACYYMYSVSILFDHVRSWTLQGHIPSTLNFLYANLYVQRMNISTALVTIEIDSLVYIACYFVLQRRPFSVRICIACNFIVSEMELRSKTLTRRRSTNSLEGAFSPRTDNPLNVQSFPAGRGINNIFQSLVVQSNLIDLRSTSQAPVLKQPSNQPPQHFDSGCSPENQKPLQNC